MKYILWERDQHGRTEFIFFKKKEKFKGGRESGGKEGKGVHGHVGGEMKGFMFVLWDIGERRGHELYDGGVLSNCGMKRRRGDVPRTL